jgi:hypothetical protein
MEWDRVLENRKQTFVFSDSKPDSSLIQQIVEEMHQFMPVKQNKILFDLLILDNTKDDKRRYDIYKSSYTYEKINPRYNPQLLAPYLLLFDVKENLITSTFNKYEALIQIGMAAMLISFSATNKNLSVGYCQCLNRDELDLIDNVQLIIGIGHAKNSDKYYCIVDKCYKTISNGNLKKIPIDEYVTYK